MSPAQLEANRANAQLSTGPKTEAGRRRSSMNAFKHGITAKIHIATPEESAAFEAHCRSYVEALAPVGKLEDELALEIAEDKWRLKRIRSVENSIFAEGHSQYVGEFETGNPQVDAAFAEGKTWFEQSRQLQLLTLYEGRIRRAIEKSKAEFKAMQDERKEAYNQAQHEAIQLSLLATSEGQTYDPAPDFTPAEARGGFIFSTSEIDRVVSRMVRLQRAQTPQDRRPRLAGNAA